MNKLGPEALQQIEEIRRQHQGENVQTPITYTEAERDQAAALATEDYSLKAAENALAGIATGGQDITRDELQAKIDSDSLESPPKLAEHYQQQSLQEQSYSSMDDAPAEVQAEYTAYLEQIESEKSPEQQAQDLADRDAYEDREQARHLRDKGERDRDDD